MGRKGGMNGHTGGFAYNRALARIAGAQGGKKSRRSENLQKKLDEIFYDYIEQQFEMGKSIHYIALRIGVSDNTIKRFAKRNALLPERYYQKD